MSGSLKDVRQSYPPSSRGLSDILYQCHRVYCDQFGCANGIGEMPWRMSAHGRKLPFEDLPRHYDIKPVPSFIRVGAAILRSDRNYRRFAKLPKVESAHSHKVQIPLGTPEFQSNLRHNVSPKRQAALFLWACRSVKR